jgi:hypothetical protein
VPIFNGAQHYGATNQQCGLYLEVYGNSSSQGEVIDTWPGNGGSNQEWAVNFNALGG